MGRFRKTSVRKGRLKLYSKGLFGNKSFNFCHPYVQGSPKHNNVSNLNIIALHSYPTSEKYQHHIQIYSQKYATRKYGA